MLRGQKLDFVCDFCMKEALVKRFPDGWMWVKPLNGEPVKHACDECVKNDAVEASRLRLPGQIS